MPLLDNEETLKAYESWEAEQSKPQSLPAHVRSQYEKAQAAVQQRHSHEEAVAPDKAANEELLAAYMSYIRLEQVCLSRLSKVHTLAACQQTTAKCACAIGAWTMHMSHRCSNQTARIGTIV